MRPLWTEFSAETIGVHAVQASADALLVSVDEPGNAAGGAGMQRAARSVPVAAISGDAFIAFCVSCLVVDGQRDGAVRMGAAGDCFAGVGLPGVESGAAKNQRLVYAKTADVFAGGGRGADDSVVDPSGATSGTILVVDWKISGSSGAAGVGRGAGGSGAAVY